MIKNNIDDDAALRMLWAGILANASLLLAVFSLHLANVLRNRRLLFKLMPSACSGSVYDCSDILLIISTNV